MRLSLSGRGSVDDDTRPIVRYLDRSHGQQHELDAGDDDQHDGAGCIEPFPGFPRSPTIEITVSGVFPDSAPANQKAVNVWIASSEDGTLYSDNDQYSGTTDWMSD
jgi:hypothetical protein